MAAPSPVKGAKTLGKNKYVLVGVLVVAAGVAYLYYKNRGSTSAGSGSAPTTAGNPAGYTTPSDSTGGGSSGPDLSGLFDSLFGLLGEQGQTIQSLALAGGSGGQSNASQGASGSSVIAPLTQTPTADATSQGPTYNEIPFTTDGGGNVAPFPTATQPSQPSTSFPTLPYIPTPYGIGLTGSPTGESPFPITPGTAPFPLAPPLITYTAAQKAAAANVGLTTAALKKQTAATISKQNRLG